MLGSPCRQQRNGPFIHKSRYGIVKEPGTGGAAAGGAEHPAVPEKQERQVSIDITLGKTKY